jgi:anti-sigma B factor antagonist
MNQKEADPRGKFMQGIKVSVNYVGARLDIALITVMGYVDTTTCQELAKIIQDLLKQKRYLIVTDLGGVTYISSAGWGVFVGEIKNIRDYGGDLKIVQMNPEVFEVFEMLEFNRVLNYYESIEEAINEFDIIRGIDITRVEGGKKQTIQKSTVHLQNPRPAVAKSPQETSAATLASPKSVSYKDYPLMEKVKMIVVENPFWGIWGICRQLRTEKYGHVRVGLPKMRSILKKLDLETKEKRYRFYRSR